MAVSEEDMAAEVHLIAVVWTEVAAVFVDFVSPSQMAVEPEGERMTSVISLRGGDEKEEAGKAAEFSSTTLEEEVEARLAVGDENEGVVAASFINFLCIDEVEHLTGKVEVAVAIVVGSDDLVVAAVVIGGDVTTIAAADATAVDVVTDVVVAITTVVTIVAAVVAVTVTANFAAVIVAIAVVTATAIATVTVIATVVTAAIVTAITVTAIVAAVTCSILKVE